MRTAAPLALVLAAAACGGASASSKGARPLPSYGGHASELFDDGMDQAAVGLDLGDGPKPGNDPVLRERAERADAVLRIRVETVTSNDDGTGPRFDLGVRTLDKLAGDHPPSETFTLRVEPTDPAGPLVRGFSQRLGGKTFIAFVSEFVRPDGDSELHYHFSADTKEVAAAVREATVLAEVR